MQVLTKKVVDASYTSTFRRPEELPKHVVDREHPVEAGLEMPDFAEVMRNGWECMFEAMKVDQPITYREFERMSPTLEFREVFEDSPDGQMYWGDLLMNLNGHYLPVFPYPQGEKFEELIARGERHPFTSSIPAEIARAHFLRVAGLGWVKEVPYGKDSYSRTWPHRVDFTTKVGSLAEEERRENLDDIAAALRKVSTIERATTDDVLYGFYVFLDTRKPGDRSDSGELWIAEEHCEKEQLFLVRSMDFSSLEVLDDPVERLDKYTSALLKRLQIS